MATSTIASAANHHDDNEQHRSFEEIYDYLTDVFAKEDFRVLRAKCGQIISELRNYPKPSYLPVNLNSIEDATKSITAEDYLCHLADDDPNADLKTLKPVKIISDGSALFRAAASLLGLSEEEDVRELRVRTLLEAIFNWLSYVNDYPELQTRASDPNEVSIQNWSHLVQEKDRMNEPNIIAVFTLIALAKVINIPIRSVYPIPSTQELNENSDHIYNLLNRVFYPVPNQYHHTETTQKPIVILWWFTQTDGLICPDTVIPLFPEDQHSYDENNSANRVLLKESNIARSRNRNSNSSVVRRRGTFILIVASISGGTKDQIRKRISDMKVTIIQRVENIAANARPGDLIEVNTCDEQLRKPPLIPFCEANTINTSENIDLINDINFRDGAHSNLQHCITAAQDRLARQSIYSSDFFLFMDNPVDGTDKTSVMKPIFRFLKKSKNIKSEMSISSEKPIDPKLRLTFPKTSPINYFQSIKKDLTRKKIIFHKRSSSLQDLTKPESSIGAIPDIQVNPVLIDTNVRLEKAQDLTEHENNGASSKNSLAIPQVVSSTHKRTHSSDERYSVPAPHPSLIKFKVGFS